MNKFEFDTKNEIDFEENTTKIISALEKIRKDVNLKLTIKTLSELTGIHRNTLRNRVWPIQKLDEIKSERVNVKAKQDKKMVKRTEDILQAKLNNAQKELLYWFTEHKKINESYNQLLKNYEMMTSARDKYRSDAEEFKNKVEDIQKKLDTKNILH